jgi:glycosyltransferase involved in cell wall biosynthesis
VEFYVTFTEDEWQACPASFRNVINNVGALVLAQCPSFYAAMDGIIFPSLLECFSAVPLEAMYMRRPLFASDLPFIRDCCHDLAIYFDPLSADSMAKAIAEYYRTLDASTRSRRLDDAFEFMQRFPSPRDRARSYIELVRAASMRRTRTAAPARDES